MTPTTATRTAAPAPPAGPPLTRAGSSGRRRAGGLLVAVVVLAGLVVLSIGLGAKGLTPRTVLEAFTAFDPSVDEHAIVREMRVPRTLAGLLVGAALGLTGTLMQGVTRNPLADPALLGVSAGAGFAVVLGIFLAGVTTLSGYVWLAFLGAAVATAAVYGIGGIGRGGASPVKLVLAGAAVTALLHSGTRVVLLSDAATLDQFRFWAVGSLQGRDSALVLDLLPFVLVGSVIAFSLGPSLNALALGDDLARGLGQRLALTRALSAVAIVLLCGAATAAAGPIVFVGLLVPHIARAIAGADYRWLLAYSAVLGPILLVAADVVGRLVVSPAELQVGIVTAVVGAPWFVWLVRGRRTVSL